MNIKLCSLIILTLAATLMAKESAPLEAPVWPNQFEQNFEETFTYPLIGSHTTKGRFIYDYLTKRYRVDRENGHYDRYCGSIYPLSNTPCTHIVAEGDRYLFFPEKDYCCYCCSAVHGCGVLRPNWLSGASFVEFTTEEGVVYEKWNKAGLQNNFYLATAGDRIMRRIDQQPNDVQNFDVKSFHEGITDASVLELPSRCSKDKVCPLVSTCTAVRQLVDNVAFLQ